MEEQVSYMQGIAVIEKDLIYFWDIREKKWRQKRQLFVISPAMTPKVECVSPGVR